MKDWSKERWRKLYLREALEQRLWSVMARGLRDYLIRLAEDDGALIRDADEPVEALLTVLGAHEGEVELVRGAIELLRRDGFLGGGARSLFVRNLRVAQSWEARTTTMESAPERAAEVPSPSTSAERVRRYRERLRLAASGALAAATGNAAEAVSCNVEPVGRSRLRRRVWRPAPDRNLMAPCVIATRRISAGIVRVPARHWP